MSNHANDVAFHERHDEELLTLEDVAQILRRPEKTIRWWRQTGKEPSSSRSVASCTSPPANCGGGSVSSGSRRARSSRSGRWTDRHGRHRRRPASRLPFGQRRPPSLRLGQDPRLSEPQGSRDDPAAGRAAPEPVAPGPADGMGKRRMKLAEAALNAVLPGARSNVSDFLPQPKQRRRRPEKFAEGKAHELRCR